MRADGHPCWRGHNERSTSTCKGVHGPCCVVAKEDTKADTMKRPLRRRAGNHGPQLLSAR